MKDPLGLAKQALEHGEAIHRWAETGEGEKELNPDWHVPFLLNEEARLLTVPFQERIKSWHFQPRSADERSALEFERYKLFRLILDHLSEKYEQASRTLDLLREIQSGKRGFVLLLWGFGTKSWHLEDANVSIVDIGPGSERDTFAEKLAPTPLLWISDPAESAVLVTDFQRKRRELGAGFRIESGRNWEENVCLLIGAASFIIVQNEKMSPGVVREIERVKELGRLSDTYFTSPENAKQICPERELKSASEENIALMRNEADSRITPGRSLPDPTCKWIEGARRQSMFEDLVELSRHVEASGKFRTPIPFDWLLDANYQLIAYAVLLELLDVVSFVLKCMCETLRRIPPEEFPDANYLIEAYGKLRNDFELALAKVSDQQPLTAQLEQIYRYLRTPAE